MTARAILTFLGLLALAGCGKEDTKLHPVRGTVRVNGQPAERVTVAFHHTDPSVKGNAAHPCTVTDEAGAFLMSTSRDGDGAVEGEYLVTFTWQSDPDPDRAKDLFNGAYNEPKKSPFRVKVASGVANDVPPFDLTIDPSRAKKFVK